MALRDNWLAVIASNHLLTEPEFAHEYVYAP